MPIPPLKRRSYGFSDKPSSRQGKSLGRVQPPSPEKKEVQRPTKPTTKERPVWLDLFIHILKKVAHGLALFFAFLWRSWKKRPRIGKKQKKKLRKSILKLAVFGFVIAFLGTVIIVAWASKDLPDPDKLSDRLVNQSTKIYDRTGEHLLYEVFANEKRTLVTLDQIPDHLIKGVIATEDKLFYEHKGIRPLSILRAVVYGILPGKRIAGTSTLTQQLVKNAILTNERRVSRKIKEIILSIQLERKFTKDQILQIYFNEIPYGSTNYGVESAAQSYFGKHVSDLDLQECATLAGLPKQPSAYLNSKDALKERRNFVLRRMFEEGYITEEEKNDAQAQELTLSRHFGDIKAPHFSLYVKEQLIDMFDEKTIDTGGLKVITSLDWDKQQIAEKVFEEKGGEVLEAAAANNLALVAMDPKTGQVLAMMGSKDFYDEDIDGQFNVATLGKRQPGSSFKPIIYTAAFEKGYTPETVLFDVKTNFAASGRSYQPLNYDLSEHGPVSMRQALQGSLNIPAVKALYLVGEKKGVEFAERLGYSTLSEGNFGLSLVLGGGEVKLLEHVNAYAVFANGGTRYEPVTILSVDDHNGDRIYEWKDKKGEKVLDPNITATISNVLSDDAARAYAFGAGGVLTLPGRPVATKTGTTNGYVDAWTVGYTPSLVTGVWGGNTNNTPMKQGFGGSKVAAPIWKAFMTEALKDTPVESFPAPQPNDAKKAVLRGSEGGSVTLLINKVTGKLASSSTPEHLIVERTYTQPHSILHYVDKDNPRGPIPEDPTVDPQYTIWESAIQDWITRKKAEDENWDISFEEPPTVEDDEYSLELMPTLTVVAPVRSSTLFSRQIDTDIRVSAPRGVTQVSYKIDDKHVGVVHEHPFNLNYFAAGLAPGNHILFITVEDDIGNRLTEEVPFTLSAEEAKPSVTWQDGNISISSSNFPKTFFLSPFKLDEIEEVNIYGTNGSNTELLASISDFSNVFNGKIVFTWDSADPGSWNLSAETILEGGEKSSTDGISVTVQ